ncbi:hypothetical protein LCGC14_0389940 [marine sediment metagenome]|uniref:Uncharacterized protein n=1 Tax=marine sediment metagenome TaxID=412755 RepID=A0A0F9THT9_9ZZZZ
MSRHDYNRVADIVMKTARGLHENEKFFVSQLATRAEIVAQAFPHDPTSVAFANFLKQRSAVNGVVFITRAELKDVYNKLYYPRNKFAEHFKNELDIEENTKTNVMLRDPREGENLVDAAYEKCADSFLSEQLTAAFDNKPHNTYSSELAKDAQRTCARELNLCGLLPKRVDVVAGQKDLLICRATYDTPKGHCHVLIPVEVQNNKALIPSFFLTTAGFTDLNAKFIKDHLMRTAGKTYQVDVQQLLTAISAAKNDTGVKPMSDVERIVMKTASAKETPATHTLNGILYKEVNPIDPPSPNLETPQLPDTEKFAARLSSNIGVAEFTFGKMAVHMGRGLIEQELKAAGHRNSQISVSGVTDSSVTYSVSVDGGFGFTVPIMIVKGKAEAPKVIVSSGRAFEFSPVGISELLSTSETNPVASAQASPLNSLKPSSLVEEVRQALAAGKHAQAEEALHVLKNSRDMVAYQAGYVAFVDSLSGRTMQKQAAAKSKCSAPVQTQTSKYVHCSHTGLPLHKVYQDVEGHCLPLYRKQMKESSEGASFLHSKIFLD